MKLRCLVESEYGRQTEGFAQSELFRALEGGTAAALCYDQFIYGICRSHLKSPHILAFLFALAPPRAADHLRHNMLEELGLDEAGLSHPSLLGELMLGAGFDDESRAQLELEAEEELRSVIVQPLLFGTLKELGLSVLMETAAFEWMLSRLASRMAHFLREHRRLTAGALRWFYHHAEVDRRHAEEGLDSIAAYARFYELNEGDAETILEVTFRENVFLKRYFGAGPLIINEETAEVSGARV